MAQLVEQDRQRYLGAAEEFGGLPGGEAERSALTRRIHHQRIERRYLQRLMADCWRWRATERVIDQQRQELGAMLQRSIERAATG